MSTHESITEIVAQLADQIEHDHTAYYFADPHAQRHIPEMAYEALRENNYAGVREMAARYLAGAATDLLRERTAAAEKRAEQQRQEQWRASWDANDDGPGGRERRKWEDRERRADEEWAERKAELQRNLDDAIAEWKGQLRIEWTAELLDSTFAMRDGTRVAWGDATVEQHRERAEMFEANAIANAQGAARHRYAIDALEAAGARSLRELGAAA